MFYIHQTTCISPQQTFNEINLDVLHEAVDNKLSVMEPLYQGIPPGLLRRMGKAVKIGVGAALPLLKQPNVIAGIIIGTANGGMEESVKFLKQIIEYDEDALTPGNFVQSTSNAVASQVSLLTHNKGYNVTHVHRGLAFENAVIDAAMMVRENEETTYLLGGVDEISSYNYNLDNLEGWNKREHISNTNLYLSETCGSIIGEGAAMFIVNGEKANAVARLKAIAILNTGDEVDVKNALQNFLAAHLQPDEKIDLLLSGENGDSRLLHFYTCCESILGDNTSVARFKHLCAEYPTASAFALWLACNIIQAQHLPPHTVKMQASTRGGYKNVLVYNNHKGVQHSFMLVCK